MSVKITRRVGRPTTPEAILTLWAVEVAEGMKEAQIAIGAVASGASLSAYEVLVKRNDVEVLTADYVSFLIEGRGPGGFPPPEEIVRWLQEKGIVPEDMTLNQLAFLIGRKIAERGTDIYEGTAPGIPLDQIVETAFDKIEREAEFLLAVQANEVLKESLNKLRSFKVF